MADVFLVMLDGGWDGDIPMSVWSTREGAEAEVVRIGNERSLGVVAATVDVSTRGISLPDDHYAQRDRELGLKTVIS
jgi:hypothetical protein